MSLYYKDLIIETVFYDQPLIFLPLFFGSFFQIMNSGVKTFMFFW